MNLLCISEVRKAIVPNLLKRIVLGRPLRISKRRHFLFLFFFYPYSPYFALYSRLFPQTPQGEAHPDLSQCVPLLHHQVRGHQIRSEREGRKISGRVAFYFVRTFVYNENSD